MSRQSNGCMTCKARRVKCDETKPICRRCQKAGVVCKGYPSPFTFIDEKPRVERALAKAQTQENELSDLRKAVCRKSSVLPLERIPEELSPVAFKDNIYISYLVSKLFEGRSSFHMDSYTKARVIYSYEDINSTWVDEIAEKPHMNALAAITFGQAHHSLNIISESRGHYGKALLNLRSDLNKSSAITSFEILASITALCMYEIVNCRTGNGWLFHADALARFMEARGPSSYKTHPENTLFLEHRVILISKAIMSGSRSFLSQTAWKTIPWEEHPSSKSPFDHLIDIFCDCAEYFAEVNGCREGMKPWQILDLKKRVFASLETLNIWWEGSSLRNPETCTEVISNPNDTIMQDADGVIFPTLLEYNGLWNAYMLCTYDATRIMLLQILEVLERAEGSETPRSPSHPRNDSSPLLGTSWDTTLLSHEILRTVAYCSNISQQFMGTFTCLFVLDIAYSCLDDNSREAKWLRARTMSQTDPLSADWRMNGRNIKVLPACQITTGCLIYLSITGRY